MNDKNKNYKETYIKYKQKYLNLKEQIGENNFFSNTEFTDILNCSTIIIVINLIVLYTLFDMITLYDMKILLIIIILFYIVILSMNEKNYKESYIKYKQKYLNLKEQIGGNQQALWIEHNFFSDTEFTNILNYCNQLSLKNDPRSLERVALCLNPSTHKKIYDYIYKNTKFINYINSIKDIDVSAKFIPSYPIEYRKYFTGSKGTPWHKDTSLFDPDCFEVVLTLTNTSDSTFEWKENNIIKQLKPTPNTLVIVRPNSVEHRVTELNQGDRTILKYIIEFVKKGEQNNIRKNNFALEFSKCPQ